MKLKYSIAWLTILLASVAHAASDRLGELSLSSFFVEPTATYADRRTGGFGFGNSYLEVNWTQQSYLSAVLKLGSSDLIGTPVRYGDEPPQTVQFIEAYGQIQSDWGQLRVGLIPIAFGIEGGDTEADLRFPRSLLFSRRLIGLRDEGFSYRITTDGFFSDWAVHNGEGGADLDSQLWFMGRFGWQFGRFVRMGASVQTGNTTPKSTDPNALTTTTTPPVPTNPLGFDTARSSHVRVADVFARYGTKTLGVEVEGAGGDTVQTAQSSTASGSTINKFRFMRADLDWQFWHGLTFLTRFDYLNPDTSLRGITVQESIAGLAWRDAYETSVLTLLFSKVDDQATQTSHQVQLIWRLTPIAMGRLNPL